MLKETKVLIIGAGPFGLSISALASHLDIEHVIVGEAMGFWKQNMPKGMYLRSACDWHLDPLNLHTIENFLQVQNKTTGDVEPLSLGFYLSYAEWFRGQKHIEPLAVYIHTLDYSERDSRFIAQTIQGTTINAAAVVMAPGFKHFAHTPEDLTRRLPPGSFQHTSEVVDFNNAAGNRYLIVGGRQSAFEWAALLLESGAASVHLSHRHESPAFEISDWSWVTGLLDRMMEDPGWYRRLPKHEQDAITRRMWAEGRLKVEPWLEPRLRDDRFRVWPCTELVSCVKNDTGALRVMLSNHETVEVDQIVLATGYKVNIAQLPYLAAGNLLERLETRNGFPVLDEYFESSIPGLFITSMPAVQDFGPFFAFTISVRASAKVICERLRTVRHASACRDAS